MVAIESFRRHQNLRDNQKPFCKHTKFMIMRCHRRTSPRSIANAIIAISLVRCVCVCVMHARSVSLFANYTNPVVQRRSHSWRSSLMLPCAASHNHRSLTTHFIYSFVCGIFPIQNIYSFNAHHSSIYILPDTPCSTSIWFMNVRRSHPVCQWRLPYSFSPVNFHARNPKKCFFGAICEFDFRARCDDSGNKIDCVRN